MGNRILKKLLSIIMVFITVAHIPIVSVAPIVLAAEDIVYKQIYASSLKNVHLELSENTEIIMDKTCYLKSISGKNYYLKISGKELMNLACDENVVDVKNFICSAPIRVSSTSATTTKYAVNVELNFISSSPELTLYGNSCLKASYVEITSGSVNVRANKYIGISADKVYIDCETIEINSVGTGITSKNSTTLGATMYSVINSETNGIVTTGGLLSDHADITLGGNIEINAGEYSIKTENGSLRGECDKLNVTEADMYIHGIIVLTCEDAQFTSTKKNSAAVHATGEIDLKGFYDIKTNGGHGILSERSSVLLRNGYYKIAGPKGEYQAIKLEKNDSNSKLRGAEGLEVFLPENGYFGEYTLFDSSGKPAKEAEIYTLIEAPDITINQPVEDARVPTSENAISNLGGMHSFSHITWYEDGVELKNGENYFKADKNYRAEVVIYAKNYAVYPQNAIGKVNGKRVNTGLSVNNRIIYLYPDFGKSLTAIKEADLTVTAPVDGESPRYYVSDSSSAYDVSDSSISWYRSDNKGSSYTKMSSSAKFVGGKYYKLEFDITAANGYAFNFKSSLILIPDITVTVNGKPAKTQVITSNDTSKIHASIEFGECNDEFIEEISVEITPPKAGEYPSYDANTLGTGYYVDTSQNKTYYWTGQHYVKNGVQWYDITNGGSEYVYENDVFLPDHKYKCLVYVKAEDQYKFFIDLYTVPETWPTGKMNGATAEINVGWTDNWNSRIMGEFTCAAQTINDIDVSELSTPLAGGNPDYTATTSAPHLYDVSEIKWYDALGEELPSNANFAPGMVYRVFIKLSTVAVNGLNVANFSASTGSTAKINSNQLEFINYTNANKNDIEDYYNHAYYVDGQNVYIAYTFKPAPKPALGDINCDNNIDIRDIVRLKRILAGLETNTSNADQNSDGKVDSLDITFIKRFLIRS